MKTFYCMLMLFVVVNISMIGCSDGPNLVPVETRVGYCDVQDGSLMVTIKNRGNEAATISSTTRIEFGSLGSFDIPTIALAPEQETILVPIPLPNGCFNPDCGFSIEVDYGNVIEETSESNNRVVGNCIG